jgi:hypothetical protein
MATTTTNFGWDIPQSTDLVKDGATAIAALGQDIDTAFVDLKGGTTGQVLTKNSGTDLDFVWSADAGIPASILDAKGDIIAATAADTASRLAVGTNGQVLTADSTAATGLKWATASAGLTLISDTTYSGVSSQSVNSVFSSTYRNYKAFISIIGSVAAQTEIRMRASGSDNTSSNYSQEADFASGSRSTGTKWQLMRTDVSQGGTAIIDFIGPYENEKTIFNNQTIGHDDTNVDGQYIMGRMTVTTAYDGFTIFPQSGTISGRITIYGYNI